MSLEGFSADQIAHAAAISLDNYERGPLAQLGIQEKPLLRILEGSKKTFSAAKEYISLGVKLTRGAGGVNDGVKGFSHDQIVNFYNPANGLRAQYVWREHHIGITMSETELKTQGILVGDEFGKVKRRGDDKGLVVLADIMDEAIADWNERYNDTMNTLLWGDGTADTSALHGIRALIQDVPTIGTVGGLSSATHTKWRNRARTNAFFAHASYDSAWGGNRVISATTNGGVLLGELEKEFRQLRRYGGRPNKFLAGSAFIDAMQTEIKANGQYSNTGFTNKQDGSIGDMTFKSVAVEYDPSLDDMGRSKYAYIWDDRHIKIRALEGDWKRMRDPARPFNQFVMHKSMVSTGQLCTTQRDSALVVEIA
mgnify:CR=1 FL=1